MYKIFRFCVNMPSLEKKNAENLWVINSDLSTGHSPVGLSQPTQRPPHTYVTKITEMCSQLQGWPLETNNHGNNQRHPEMWWVPQALTRASSFLLFYSFYFRFSLFYLIPPHILELFLADRCMPCGQAGGFLLYSQLSPQYTTKHCIVNE